MNTLLDTFEATHLLDVVGAHSRSLAKDVWRLPDNRAVRITVTTTHGEVFILNSCNANTGKPTVTLSETVANRRTKGDRN